MNYSRLIFVFQVLEPFYDATNIMSSQLYPTLSAVIPVLDCINGELTKLKQGCEPGSDGTEFITLLQRSILARFQNPKKMQETCNAMVLDPRWKHVLLAVSNLGGHYELVVNLKHLVGPTYVGLEM